MRKLISIFIFLLSTPAFSQYQSLFGDSVTKWNLVQPTAYFSNEMVYWYSDSLVEVNGDTLHRVVFSASENDQLIYVKENVSAGKAWACSDATATNCELFFDLGLQNGDSIAIGGYPFNSSEELIHVDSVYWDQDGKKHIRFTESYAYYDHFEMMEGVGTAAGLFKFQLNSFSESTLVCQQKDGQSNYVFNHPAVENCQFVLGIDELESANWHIYPNPVSDFILLENKSVVSAESIALLDLSGKVVRTFEKSSVQLDVQDVLPGMYFVQLVTKTGNSVCKVEIY